MTTPRSTPSPVIAATERSMRRAGSHVANSCGLLEAAGDDTARAIERRGADCLLEVGRGLRSWRAPDAETRRGARGGGLRPRDRSRCRRAAGPSSASQEEQDRLPFPHFTQEVLDETETWGRRPLGRSGRDAGWGSARRSPSHRPPLTTKGLSRSYPPFGLRVLAHRRGESERARRRAFAELRRQAPDRNRGGLKR